MRLVVDISGHGYGHLTQISPVIGELKARLPALEIVLRSNHNPRHVQQCLQVPFETCPAPPDISLIMNGPDQVNRPQSHAAYQRLHEGFRAVVAEQAESLSRLRADYLISNVAYTGLAGAQKLGIPSVALCSLHWGEMVERYLGAYADIDKILGDIYRAYNSARMFIMVGPRRNLGGLGNLTSVPPIVRNWGRNRGDEIRAQFETKLSPDTRLGIISFGGITGSLPETAIPGAEKWVWIVPDGFTRQATSSAPLLARSALAHMDFLDIIASADLVVTKTGYGTFVECAAYGVPCLFLARKDWPEAHDLENWIRENRIGMPVTACDLRSPHWLEKACARTPPAPINLTGHILAADLIMSAFDLSS